MTDYKFLHTRDIDRVLNDETVRISSLAHFQKMEQEQWIADRLEGTSQVQIDHWRYNADEADEFAPPGHRLPFGVGPSGGLTITNSLIQYALAEPTPFIFCASRGDLKTLTSTMCEANNPYDACLEIADIQRLAHRMFHRGSVIELGNIKMHGLFAGFRVAEVTYDNLLRDQATRHPPPPNPFRKHIIFAPQSEVRMAFQPRATISPLTLTVKIPRVQTILAERFRDRISGG